MCGKFRWHVHEFNTWINLNQFPNATNGVYWVYRMAIGSNDLIYWHGTLTYRMGNTYGLKLNGHHFVDSIFYTPFPSLEIDVFWFKSNWNLVTRCFQQLGSICSDNDLTSNRPYLNTWWLILNSQYAESYSSLTRSFSRLLMPWLIVSSSHQWPWYWQVLVLHQERSEVPVLSVWRNDRNCKYTFMFLLKI